MSPREQTQIAAFFDIDGTLVPPPSLEWRFFRRMNYRRAIPAGNYWLWLLEAVRLAPRGISALRHTNKMYLRGTQPGVEARRFVPPHIPFDSVVFFPPGVERVAWHAVQRHAIALVSGTLEPLAQNAARLLEAQLGVRGCEATVRVCATRIEQSGGRYTGRILGEAMAGAEKAHAVRRLAAAEGWDLARSFAYGDNASDRWLLETVGYPTAINATARLARIASRRGWPMLQWRSENRPPGRGNPGHSLVQEYFGS